MIYTLTLNPAVDYYIDMNSFEEGELNKVDNAYTLAGGKGINVSKVLKNFNIDSVALGFCGGFTGDYIKKHLKEYGIKEHFIYLEEDTRINIKLKTSKTESEIAGKSPNISKEKVQSYIRFKSKEILDNVTSIFLKQNGMNTYGINLEEKLEMCKSYEEFSFISDNKEGVLYHNGDKIDLNEFLNGNIVSIENNNNENDFLDLIEFDNSI